jgi:hypothetical protein
MTDIIKALASAGEPLNRKSTVRLSISDANMGLIGFADFGTAVTERTVALSDEVRKLLVRYGYSRCILVLDAEENLESHKAPHVEAA